MSWNRADQGGGLAVEESSATLIGCSIHGNWVGGGNGGGLFCSDGASPVLRGCTVSSNYAGVGGGVYCEESSPNLERCVISGNSLQGVCCTLESSPAFRNCLLVGNFVGIRRDGLARLYSCTLADNLRGGVDCGPGGFSATALTNCILWNNGPDPDCGTFTHCLSEADPRFVRPGVYNFDGSTTVVIGGEEVELPDFAVEPGDYHLLPDSPAIDAGTADEAPETDFEGNARPCGGNVDIGAYESGDCVSFATFKRGHVNDDDVVDLSDAVYLLAYLFLGGPGPRCLDAADTDDSGSLDLTDAVCLLNHLFLGGPELPGPYLECGRDETEDDLHCETFPSCDP
jgi:hypothetical protein